MNSDFESTYALLVRSEEKSRNVLEMVIYPLLIIGAVIAIWQFVLQPVDVRSRDTAAVQQVASISSFHPYPYDRQSGNSSH